MSHQLLLDQLQTAVVILNPQLQIDSVNAAAETLLDNSASRLRQQPFLSLFRSTSLNPQWLKQCLLEQQSVSDSEVVLELHNHHRLTVELLAQPLTVAPWQGHVLLEMRQIDQIQRINQEARQQQQLLAAQALVRGLAHEIKNPLGGLRGAAQLLERELDDEEQREYTRLIIAQADRLRGLVDRLLGPNQVPDKQWINPHKVLEHASRMVALENPELTLVRDYDPSLPDLWVAPDAIEQVVLNILQNAAQATDSRGKVTVRTRVLHQQTLYGRRYKQCAVIAISDDGPGIPPQLRETLFYPMVTGRANGTGLGLSIAQSLVHQHDGKIALNPESEHTEFLIYLPYHEAEA